LVGAVKVSWKATKLYRWTARETHWNKYMVLQLLFLKNVHSKCTYIKLSMHDRHVDITVKEKAEN